MTFRVDCGDAFAWLASRPSASVDCVFTDPPYASLEKHRTGAESVRRLTDWFDVIPNEVYGELLSQFARILRDNRHCYIMADEETMDAIKAFTVVDKRNDRWFDDGHNKMRYWKAIVWDKQARGMGYHYANSHEFVMMFEKGKRSLETNEVRSIVRVPTLRDGGPAEKPVELPKVFLRNSTMPRMTVCDPFVGQGSTAVAALQLDLDFVGCDNRADFCERTVTRCQLEMMK